MKERAAFEQRGDEDRVALFLFDLLEPKTTTSKLGNLSVAMNPLVTWREGKKRRTAVSG